MTTVSYKIVDISDAVDNLYPLEDWWVDDEGTLDVDEYFNVLYEFRGDQPIRIVATDGGEPEDQTLTRNWAWVEKELTDAWENGRSYGWLNGYSEGRSEGYAEGFYDGRES